MIDTALQWVDLIDREEFVLVFFDAERKQILSVSHAMNERIARLTLGTMGKDKAKWTRVVQNSRSV